MLWRLLASHMREHKCQMPCRMNVLFVVFAASVGIAAANVVAVIAVTTLFVIRSRYPHVKDIFALIANRGHDVFFFAVTRRQTTQQLIRWNFNIFFFFPSHSNAVKTRTPLTSVHLEKFSGISMRWEFKVKTIAFWELMIHWSKCIGNRSEFSG